MWVYLRYIRCMNIISRVLRKLARAVLLLFVWWGAILLFTVLVLVAVIMAAVFAWLF